MMAILFSISGRGLSQIISFDTYLDTFNSSCVKSLDEFIQRFNGEEFHPDLDTANTANIRARSILTLIDWQKYQLQDSSAMSQVVSFVDSVCKNDVRLALEKDGIYAEAQCLFLYNQQELPISLILVFENIRDDYYKWAVVGTTGLVECGLIDTIREGYINPVQHELHFSELSAACADLTSHVSITKTVDQLSFLLGMLKTKQLEFVTCNKVVFHFVQVPGYAFVVEEVNRLDNNSGYLVNALFKMEDSDKLVYIKQLLGQDLER